MRWDIDVSDNGEQPYSQVNHLLDSEQGITSLAYCLPRYSKLDGSYLNTEDTIEAKENGYISLSLSNENGVFENKPVINIKYDRLKTSNGLYMVFNRLSGDYPRLLEISWYKDDELVLSKEFYPDSVEYTCSAKVKLFNRISIAFKETAKPYRHIWLAALKNTRLSDAGGLKIVYEDIALGAKENACISSSDKDYYVDLENLKEEIEYPDYAMCLPRYSKLNGDYFNTPDNLESMGYVSSSISGSDSYFESPPSIEFIFSENYSSVGISLVFNTHSEDYCSELNIKWYRDNELLSDMDFNPDSASYFCHNLVNYYNKVVITFIKTSKPYRNAFLIDITFGLIREFTDNELKSVSCLLEVNPISSELTINTMSYTVKDKLGYNFDFQKKQKQTLYFNEAIMGIFYLKDGNQLSVDRYSIEAQDAVGLLDNNNFMGGMYQDKKVTELIGQIMDGEGINYFLDDSYKKQSVSGYLPICTKRQALQQAAFAIGAVVNTGYDRHLYIYPKQESVSGEFTNKDIYTGLSLSHDELVTGVKVYTHSYTKSDESAELYKGKLTGVAKVEFSEPYHSLSITNGSIAESGVNYAYIKGTGLEVILTGKRYDHATTAYQKVNGAITNTTNIAEVKNATLVTESNIESVLNRVYEEYEATESIKFKAVIGEQEIGDIVEVDTGFKGIKKGMIRSLNLNFSKHEVSAEVVVK